MKMVNIPLNTLPGLEALPDDVTLPGYSETNNYIPDKDPNYIFRLDDVRVLFGHLTSDTRNGLLFTGPKGCGKSSVFHQLHAYLNRPLFYINGHASLEFEDLLGTKEIVDGDTITMDGPLVQAAQMPYATFLFEEVDRARSSVSVSMNPILDGYDIVHTLDSGRKIKPAAGFNCWFTSNTNGQGDLSGDYNSANVMDTSFLDRNWCYEGWYPSPEDEFKILRQSVDPEIADEQLHQSVAFANDVRYLYTRRDAEASSTAQQLGVGETIHATVSTRALVMIWEIMSIFPMVDNPIAHALKLAVTSKCTPECAEAIQRLAEASFAGDA